MINEQIFSDLFWVTFTSKIQKQSKKQHLEALNIMRLIYFKATSLKGSLSSFPHRIFVCCPTNSWAPERCASLSPFPLSLSLLLCLAITFWPDLLCQTTGCPVTSWSGLWLLGDLASPLSLMWTVSFVTVCLISLFSLEVSVVERSLLELFYFGLP